MYGEIRGFRSYAEAYAYASGVAFVNDSALEILEIRKEDDDSWIVLYEDSDQEVTDPDEDGFSLENPASKTFRIREIEKKENEMKM